MCRGGLKAGKNMGHQKVGLLFTVCLCQSTPNKLWSKMSCTSTVFVWLQWNLGWWWVQSVDVPNKFCQQLWSLQSSCARLHSYAPLSAVMCPICRVMCPCLCSYVTLSAELCASVNRVTYPSAEFCAVVGRVMSPWWMLGVVFFLSFSIAQLQLSSNAICRKRSKQMREVRRMVCDCTTSKEDHEMGYEACGEDCLNRMLFIEWWENVTLLCRLLYKGIKIT